MGISTISGLPAHPLFIHLPVIGIPVTALALLAYVLLPARRPTLFWVVGALTIGITGATIIAANTGEKLEAMMSPEDRNSALVHKHTQLGDQTQTIVIIFAGVTLAYLALDWWRRRTHRRCQHIFLSVEITPQYRHRRLRRARAHPRRHRYGLGCSHRRRRRQSRMARRRSRDNG